MDIVKRAYLNTLNNEPDDCPLPDFRRKVREEIIRLITLEEEKATCPEFSFFGDPNWKMIDAQIEIARWAKGEGDDQQ